jgi:hypothetical protein
VTTEFRLYRPDGTAVSARQHIKSVYSGSTPDRKRGIIRQLVSYSLCDGTDLNRVDDLTFESTVRERFSLVKPS